MSSGALALPGVLWARIPHGRGAKLVASVVVATVIAGAASLIPGSSTAPVAPSGAAVWVATNGNDATCVRGNQSFPCLTFNCAYHVAQNGDQVDVAAGAYGPQLIQRAVPAGCANGTTHYTESDVADVTIQPSSGATVSVGDLMLGAWWNQCGNGSDPADPTWSVTNLTIKNISDNNSPGGSTGCGQVGGGTNDCMWQIAGSSHITWDNITTCTITIVGSTTTHDVVIKNSHLGNCFVTTPSGPDCYNNKIVDGASYVTFDNDVIHDILLDPNAPGDPLHGECMFIGANSEVDHITVRNSKFYNCDIYDIFVQTGEINHVTIENNWFDRPLVYGSTSGGDRAIAFSTHNFTFSDLLVRYNSFADGAIVGWDDDNQGFTYPNSHFYGNIIWQGCPGNGVVADYNVVLGGNAVCGAHDVSATASNIYVNAASQRNGGDLHLKAGANTAVDMVTPNTLYFDLGTAPWSGAPATDDDIDGDTRTPGARDAGSDER